MLLEVKLYMEESVCLRTEFAQDQAQGSYADVSCWYFAIPETTLCVLEHLLKYPDNQVPKWQLNYYVMEIYLFVGY